MTKAIQDSVFETTITQGTGDYTLAGAVVGGVAFADMFGDGDTVYYCVRSAGEDGQFETGEGVYTVADNTLSRVEVYASSNSGAAVNWGTGTRNIFCSASAVVTAVFSRRLTAADTGRAVVVDADGHLVPAGLDLMADTVGGTANAITLSTTPAQATLVDGDRVRWTAAADNTGAATAAINGGAALAIKKEATAGLTDIAAGDIQQDAEFGLVKLGSVLVLSDPVSQIDLTPYAAKSANLGDLASASESRTNLDVYSKGEVDALAGGIMAITAGEDLSDRNLGYFDSFDQRGGGAGLVYKVDADAVGPVRISKKLCIVVGAVLSGVTGFAQVAEGAVSGFTGLTVGVPVYASATAGALTQTVPAIPADGTQTASRFVGFATSATAIWFAPDSLTTFVKYGATTAIAGTITVESFTDLGNAERVPRAYRVATALVTTTSTAGAWTTTTGYSYGSGTITSPGGNTAIKLATTLTGDFSFTWTDGSSSEGGIGFYHSSEDATFSAADNRGGMSSMTNSFYYAHAFGALYYGGASVLSQAGTVGAVYKLERVGSAVTFKKNGALQHTFAASSSGPVRLVVACNGASTLSAVSWTSSSGAVRNEEEPCFPESRFSGATDKITHKFSDASDGNQSTMMTFINRTDAECKLVVEVTL